MSGFQFHLWAIHSAHPSSSLDLSLCACVLSCSVMPDSLLPCQAPLSMGFFRSEYCSELPFPPPGDLPNPGIEPTSPISPALAAKFFITEPSGKPLNLSLPNI